MRETDSKLRDDITTLDSQVNTRITTHERLCKAYVDDAISIVNSNVQAADTSIVTYLNGLNADLEIELHKKLGDLENYVNEQDNNIRIDMDDADYMLGQRIDKVNNILSEEIFNVHSDSIFQDQVTRDMVKLAERNIRYDMNQKDQYLESQMNLKEMQLKQFVVDSSFATTCYINNVSNTVFNYALTFYFFIKIPTLSIPWNAITRKIPSATIRRDCSFPEKI